MYCLNWGNKNYHNISKSGAKSAPQNLIARISKRVKILILTGSQNTAEWSEAERSSILGILKFFLNQPVADNVPESGLKAVLP